MTATQLELVQTNLLSRCQCCQKYGDTVRSASGKMVCGMCTVFCFPLEEE